MTEKKTFSCLKCGTPFDAYPPDEVYTIARREESKDAIKIEYKCKRPGCRHKNAIYWVKPAPPVVL